MWVDESKLEQIRKKARRLVEEAGLDPWPVTFGVVNHHQINELAAYEGFPERYPHWRFGMSYEHFRKRAQYSNWWTYEMVINTEPALAYLRASNTTLENKAIMVHVYAHVDFFKNNKWIEKTSAEMVKILRNHARRIEEYMDRYGVEEVESFIDKVLSIQYNIDQHALFIQRRRSKKEEDTSKDEVVKIPVKREYMDRFINPPRWIEELEKSRQSQRKKPRLETELKKPQKDLLKFLMTYGQLEDWQADILSMVREESYYFAPSSMTKIMNEGWASYWQSRIMTEYGFAEANEIIDHADMQSKVLGGGVLNPYSLGKLIWDHIKESWDKGRFGREWENCQDKEKLANWDTQAGLGKEKIFEVRKNYNDITFIDEFFTQKLADKLNLFAYEYIPETGAYHITSRDFNDIKKKLLLKLTNLGNPTIKVKTGNYDNKGELLLIHKFNGIPLHLKEAKKVLANIYGIWGRPVNLKTILLRRAREPDPKRDRLHPDRPLTAATKQEGVLIRYDGEKNQAIALTPEEVKDIRLDEESYNSTPADWVG